jgi:CRISPR-associated protein Cas2
MALNESRRWLVAYDIREPRRLARVHRLLTRTAVPVQYSVFVARGSFADMRRLAKELRCSIDERADDVRIYSIPVNPVIYTIGRAMLSEDAWLLDGKTDIGALLKGAGSASACGDSSESVSSGRARKTGKDVAKGLAPKENLKRSA